MGNAQDHWQLECEERILPNGMRLLFDYVPHVRSASIGIWALVGSARETPEQTGISHFLEHLLFKGTPTHTARDLVVAVEGKGGHLNAYTSKECTCIYAQVLDKHVPEAINILGDIIINSDLRDLEKERAVILEEIATAEDVPEDHIYDMLMGYLWPTHPMGHPILGYEETINVMDPDAVAAFYREWYSPHNLIFSISGRFDKEAVYKQAMDLFGPMPAGTLPPPIGEPVFNPGIITEDRDIGQIHLQMGYPAICSNDPKRLAHVLLSNTLGGGATSRLFERVREQEGLAYTVYSHLSSYPCAGLTCIYAAVAPSNLERTLDLIREETTSLCEKAVPEDELEMNREQLRGGILMSLESTYSRMSGMAKSIIYRDRMVSIEETMNDIAAVTTEDIMEAAQATFQEDRCAIAQLGPEDGEESEEESA